MKTLNHIMKRRLVAVIRADDGDRLVDVAEALVAGGVDVLEVTFTVPAAHTVVEKVRRALGSRAIVGAGTVLDEATARLAILSGAQFVVGPNTDEGVIACCRRYGVPVMPGAMTPTEVVRAWQAGADVVKVFPSDTLGPAYLKALRGPLPQIPLMPTGGVNLETAPKFLRAGAAVLGVGGSLVNSKAITNQDYGTIEDLARQFVAVVEQTMAEIEIAH